MEQPELSPGSVPPVGDGEALFAGKAKLAAAEQKLYVARYGRNWRTIYRWVAKGEECGEACPLHDAEKMPGWWTRHFKQVVPSEIEAAAVAARLAREGGPAAPVKHEAPGPAASPVLTGQSSSVVAGGDGGSGEPGTGKGFRLEDFDPDDGDRLRELKQLQAVKFRQMRNAIADGLDTGVMEQKYVKLCETIDKIETRAIERMKKRGVYILRVEVERDLAANAELLRQTRESMGRRVLEQCSSLNEAQRAEVAAAITRARAREDSILAKLDCLTADDLLRELAA